MNLKYLVISDTHLGEPSSLLSFPAGLQHLWQTLRSAFGHSAAEELDKIHVDEVILLGDIPDRTLSSTTQITVFTNAFVRMLASAAEFNKLVYIFGNHDHSLWTNYLKRLRGPDATFGVTGPEGKQLIRHDDPMDQDRYAEEMLGIFFEYPYGSFWNQIIDKRKEGTSFEFVIANPLYTGEFKNRKYAFAHGTHFRREFAIPQVLREIAAMSGLSSLLAGVNLEAGGVLEGARHIYDLERATAPMVDSIWPDCENNSATRNGEFWCLFKRVGGMFFSDRPAPESSVLVKWEDLPQHPQIAPLADDPKSAGSLERWYKYFRQPMLNELGLQTPLGGLDGITFVYGDTHKGGWHEWKDLPGVDLDTRIYNTGGWLVYDHDAHPPCHVFAVDTDGNEYMLDVSFKYQRMGTQPLLDLAAKEFKYRDGRVDLKALQYRARRWWGSCKEWVRPWNVGPLQTRTRKSGGQ